MKNNTKFIFGVIILIVILAGAYFAFGSGGASITGAFTGSKECISSDAEDFFDACSSWKASGYKDKPRILKVMTDTSTRQMCDKLFKDYKAC